MNALVKSNLKIVCGQCRVPLNDENRCNERKIVNANTRMTICIDCNRKNFERWGDLPDDILSIVFEYASQEIQYIRLYTRLVPLYEKLGCLWRTDDKALFDIPLKDINKLLTSGCRSKKTAIYTLTSVSKSYDSFGWKWQFNRLIGTYRRGPRGERKYCSGIFPDISYIVNELNRLRKLFTLRDMQK